jgi:hypothetical protein
MSPRIKIKTAVELMHVFWPDFVERDGSIFLPWEKVVQISDFEHGLDFTGMEAFQNHTHIIDLFGHEAGREPAGESDDCFFDYNHPDFMLLCEAGKKLAQMWFQKLRVDFPHYRFRVYYTQEDNPIVRFHRVRAEEPYWLDEEMYGEDVKLGKIIVYDTGEPSVH